MKKRNFVLWLFLTFILSASIFAWFPVNARADFGDFAGDTDYGGSDWGSDWSSDSSDWGSDSSDWSSDDGDSYSGSEDDEGILEIIFGEEIAGVIYTIVGGAMFLGVVGIVIYGAVSYVMDLGKRFRRPKQRGAQERSSASLKSMADYLKLDPKFDEEAFREHLSNLYIQMQECWHERNIESLKPYFTDAFYNQSDRQLKMKIKSGQTPCTERVAVLEVTPKGFYQKKGTGEDDPGIDHIVVTIRSRLVAYTLDDKTGKIISGDRSHEKFMTYEWDLCRKSGVVTTPKGGMQSIVCPHCGAPLNINQTAKCPYCDSIITVVNEDWALNNIKGIAQQTIR